MGSILPEMEAKRRRKLELKERKNYMPTLGVILVMWLSLILMLVFVDPQEAWAIPVFLLMVFVSVLFPVAILFGNTRRGLLTAIVITVLLGLRIVNLASPLNVILLLGTVIAFEFYYSRM